VEQYVKAEEKTVISVTVDTIYVSNYILMVLTEFTLSALRFVKSNITSEWTYWKVLVLHNNALT